MGLQAQNIPGGLLPNRYCRMVQASMQCTAPQHRGPAIAEKDQEVMELKETGKWHTTTEVLSPCQHNIHPHLLTNSWQFIFKLMGRAAAEAKLSPDDAQKGMNSGLRPDRGAHCARFLA